MNKLLASRALGAAMTVAMAVALSGCGSSSPDGDQATNMTPVDTSGASNSDNGSAIMDLAIMAENVASHSGEAADLAERLDALGVTVEEHLADMPTEQRDEVANRLHEMRRAIEAGNWAGAQEAAASISAALKSTSQ